MDTKWRKIDTMDLTDTICSLVDKPTSHADVDTVDDTAAAPADEATEPSAPRGLTSENMIVNSTQSSPAISLNYI